MNFGPPDWLPWGTYVANKYRREGRSATLSHDALLIALVTAAPDVRKRLEREAKVGGCRRVCRSGFGSIDGCGCGCGCEEGQVHRRACDEVLLKAQQMPHQARRARRDSLQPSVRFSTLKWSPGSSMKFKPCLW